MKESESRELARFLKQIRGELGGALVIHARVDQRRDWIINGNLFLVAENRLIEARPWYGFTTGWHKSGGIDEIWPLDEATKYQVSGQLTRWSLDRPSCLDNRFPLRIVEVVRSDERKVEGYQILPKNDRRVLQGLTALRTWLDNAIGDCKESDRSRLLRQFRSKLMGLLAWAQDDGGPQYVPHA